MVQVVFGYFDTKFLHITFKGAMCNISEDLLLTEMQYKIHNYVFSGVSINCYVFITLE